MLDVVWLFQKDLWQEDDALTKAAVERAGYRWRDIEYVPFTEPDFSNIEGDNETCIFYGSLNLAKKLRPHIKGVYCDLPKFECTNYYPYYEDHLLNTPYIMLPFGSLKQRYEDVFDFFFPDSPDAMELFIRPSSGFKLFTGQLISFDNFEREFDLLGYTPVDSGKIVILSYPKPIDKEWRVVIINGRAVSASVYKKRGSHAQERISDEDKGRVYEFAENIAKLYSPENIFCVDVCNFVNGQALSLVEINCFSCSGLYDCDRQKVVEEVSNAHLLSI